MRVGNSIIPEVGDYVLYTPIKHSVVIPAELSGYDADQHFYPFHSKLWKIFSIDENQIQLINAKGIGTLILSDEAGYRNAIEVLQRIAEGCVNPKYAVEGRCLGYEEGAIRKIKTSMSRRYIRCHRGAPYTDEHYVADVDWMKSNKQLMPKEIAWLASRFMSYKGGEFDWTYFGVRTFVLREKINILFGKHVCVKHMYSQIRGSVYTIITLKDGAKLKGGEGTKEEPYKIVF